MSEYFLFPGRVFRRVDMTERPPGSHNRSMRAKGKRASP
jgi:hypothetical protein